MRDKAKRIADRWHGETWKAALIYALLYIGDCIKEGKC